MARPLRDMETDNGDDQMGVYGEVKVTALTDWGP